MKRILFIFLCLSSLNSVADGLDEANILFQSGDYHAAADLWQSALQRETRKPQRIALLLRLAEVYQTGGQREKTAQWLEVAWQQVETPEQRLRVLNHRIENLLTQQKSTEAWDLLQELLALARQINKPALLARVFNNEGNVLRFLDNYSDALLAYQDALTQAEKAEDTLLQARILGNAADTAWLGEQVQEALVLLKQALRLLNKQTRGHERLREELALARLALRLQRSLPQTLALAGQILQGVRKDISLSKDLRLHSYLYAYLGQAYESAGRYEEALQLTDRARFFSQQDEGLEYLWLWQRGRLFQAQGKTDEAVDSYRKALTLLQPLRSALLLGQRNAGRVFREEIRPVYYALADVLLQQAKTMKDGEQQQAVLEETRTVLESMKAAELEDYFRDECVAAVRQRFTPSVAGLSPRTAVLYPVLLPNRTELLVHLAGGLQRVSVAVAAERVNTLALDLQKDLQILTRWQFAKQSGELYDILIRPLHPLLAQHQIETLIFVPDGPLRMIPPAVLKNGKHYLIEEFALAVTPGLDMTDTDTLPHTHMQTLLTGLSAGVQGFSPLPAVETEIKRISALYQQTVTLLNRDFALSKMEQTLSSDSYRIIHMATHGQFERDPEKSFLLAYDNKITMNRLESLLQQGNSEKRHIELLTLSACQTAIGDERAALGLAGVAIKSGARSAIASLWYVSDEATAELVVEFYRRLQNGNINKAEALRQAQRKLIGNKRFSHPGYWAPFMLIGSWL